MIYDSTNNFPKAKYLRAAHPLKQPAAARVRAWDGPAEQPGRPARGGEPRNSASGFGEVLRRLRGQARLTLKELGVRTGLSASTLSKIESGLVSPTYEKIVILANALDIDVAELFGDAHRSVATGRRSVCRRAHGVVHRTVQYDYEMLCADLTGKHFLPMVATLRARSVHDFPAGLLRHAGEEFIYVLEGTVTVHSEFYEPLRLEPGDSCYFDSRMGHANVSSGERDARVLWVCSRNTPLSAVQSASANAAAPTGARGARKPPRGG